MTDTIQEPTTETKAQKFTRISEMRLARILDDLRLLGNCGNASNYEYNGNDIHRVFSRIEKETARVRALFNKPVPIPHTAVTQASNHTISETSL